MTLIELDAPARRGARLGPLPVAIIGAGPIGLAAAAHLVERGIDFRIYEAGPSVASAVASWGHVRLFSPWEHLIDPAARRLLASGGWAEPDPAGHPTGAELVTRYLEPLASVGAIASRTETCATVEAVSRVGMDRTRSAGRAEAPFLIRLRHAGGGRGGEHEGGIREETASAVIDASGTSRSPNGLASTGLDPLGFAEVAGEMFPALPDVLGVLRSRFAGRHTVVVGAGHSAANTLIALAALAREEPATRVTWAIRKSEASRVSSSAGDELRERASIGARVDELVASGDVALVDRFEVARVRRAPSGGVRVSGTRRGEAHEIDADIVVNATGFRPDLSMLREIRLELDDIVEAPRRLAPLIDPNLHSCGTVPPHGFAELAHPEANFFIAGMKSYGRAPTFLLSTGYEQVRSIVAWLAGDDAAAAAVELELPATGVCSGAGAAPAGAPRAAATGGCCS